MPLNKVIKNRIEEVITNHEHDELDFGFVMIDDIIDDLNYIINSCPVRGPVYTECVEQLERLSEEGIIDPDDKDYAISQLFS
jgi:hypothetical protein